MSGQGWIADRGFRVFESIALHVQAERRREQAQVDDAAHRIHRECGRERISGEYEDPRKDRHNPQLNRRLLQRMFFFVSAK